MHFIPYAIEEKYEQRIVEDYKEVLSKYNELKDKTEKVFEEVKTDEKSRDRINSMDSTIIEKDENQYMAKFVAEYVENKNDSILKFLKRDYEIDTNKLHKVFSTRNKIISKRIENLNSNNLGTVLNILNNFYSDILNDVKRNRNEWEEYEEGHIKSIFIDDNEIPLYSTMLPLTFDQSDDNVIFDRRGKHYE
ncbi:hypothetical protein ACTWP4_18560 [Gracilibacillus sp. D59]|uniref:hypothetical protein n=1 Tax=Gracilibacillus sp. D59 TaxID=3457434 RepID=UPI003FCD2801